jgi:predicted outer membrane repeat protein
MTEELQFGSTYHDRHTGTLGRLGTLSFNGNKTITTGGGGAILTDDTDLARRAKHLTTTAKVPHRWA